MIGIYHYRDLDGWTSAVIMREKYPDIKLIGYDHYQPFDYDLTGEDVILADIILPIDKMIEISHIANSFLWIDHHESNYILYLNNKDRFDKIEVVYGEMISACELTWNQLFPDYKMPHAVQYAGECDVFRRPDLNHWENVSRPFAMGMMMICSSVNSYPLEILYDDDALKSIIDDGMLIKKYQDRMNSSICKNTAYEVEFHGLNAICICSQPHSSLVFNDVYDPNKHDVMIMYHFTGEYWKYSIYTTSDVINCSDYANIYGGGGHRQASGFQTPELILLPKK